MLFPVETIASLKLSVFIMVIFGALDELPSRTMIESPFIFRASNHSRTLLPVGKLITHVQLEDPGRENNCGDDVIIPCDSVSLHPQEHSDPEAVNVKEAVNKTAEFRECGHGCMRGHISATNLKPFNNCLFTFPR